MAQSFKSDPVPKSRVEQSPENLNGQSPPLSPLNHFLDADVANILSRFSPQKGENTSSNGLKENTVQNQDLNLEDSSKAPTVEKELKDMNVPENPKPPSIVPTELTEKIESSSENSLPDKELNNLNGSSTLSAQIESLDKNASLYTESKVPMFCVTIQEESENSNAKEMEIETMDKYREEKALDSDDSSVSSDSSSDCSDSFLYELRKSVKYVPSSKSYNVKPPEDYYADLIALEDLNINIKESEVEKVGIVHAIVNLEVVIKSREGLKPLQLNSVLFLSTEKTLGLVCDVYGPVKSPFYSVKYNSEEHLKKVGVEVGMEVFYAPKRTEMTQYVFPEELQKLKGSDASGLNDNEPSDDNVDFSDDEKEKEAKSRRKRYRRPDHGKDSRCEPARTNRQERSHHGSNEPSANPFYSVNQDGPEIQDWTPQRYTTPSSYPYTPSYKETNLAQSRNSYATQRFAPSSPSPSSYQNPPQSPFHPPVSHFPQPDQSPFQPPSPLVGLQFHAQPLTGHIPYPPPSPLPVQMQQTIQMQPSQCMSYSQGFGHQQPPVGPPRPILLQQQPPVSPPRPTLLQQQPYGGPPRTTLLQQQPYGGSLRTTLHQQQPYGGPPRSISLPQQPHGVPPRSISFQQQMHMFGQMTPLGPMSPAPQFSYAPPTIASPPPSTAFPPASPNFSYFSHPFPSAHSPGPNSMSHFRATPSPSTIQVMPPMSPLSIQIPSSVRSPPVMVSNNYNLQQQNYGQYRQRY